MTPEMLKFLCGEGPLDGVWFGELHPSYPGAYWWRAFLRQEADNYAATIDILEQTRRELAACQAVTTLCCEKKAAHPEAALPSVIEQHGLCVSFDPKAKLWNAQDCRYNALVRGATLDEAVQKLMPKLMRCQRCQITTTREVHVFYCKAEDCEVRQPLPQKDES